MKKTQIFKNFLISAIIAAFLTFISVAEEIETTPGNFKWALVSLNEESITPVGGPAIDTEYPEDLFLFFSPLSNAYIYLFILSPSKGLQLAFPGSFDEFQDGDYFGSPYFISLGDYLGDPGGDCHEIYFLVSIRRLPEIENIFTEYYTLTPATKEQRNKLISGLMTAIKRLQIDTLLIDIPIVPIEPVTGPFEGPDEMMNEIKALGNIIIINKIYETLFTYSCGKN